MAAKLKKAKSAKVIKELEKFVSHRKSKIKDIKVLLVWWPRTSKTRIDIYGKYVIIRNHPLKEFDGFDIKDITGAMVKSYLSTLSPNFKNNLAKSFKENCPGREADFLDSLLIVFRDIRHSKISDKKAFTLFKEWDSRTFVNIYSRLLFVMVEEGEKARVKMGGGFIHKAAGLCSEIHQLAISP